MQQLRLSSPSSSPGLETKYVRWKEDSTASIRAGCCARAINTIEKSVPAPSSSPFPSLANAFTGETTCRYLSSALVTKRRQPCSFPKPPPPSNRALWIGNGSTDLGHSPDTSGRFFRASPR